MKANYVVLTITFEKDGDVWIARCEELGTAIQASTLEDAKVAIREAVELHLNGLEEEHERERFFEENNIMIFATRPPKSISVNVPERGNDVFIQAMSIEVS